MLNIGKKSDGHLFKLAVDLVTSTQAILARKRSGKSYTASVEAEELLKAGQQIGVFDPTAAWWGLRSSANGEGEGYPIVVFGGDHSDAPLDPRAGKAMARAFIEQGFSAIFDVSNLHTEEQIQFVMDFSSEMLRLNRTAVHLFMDEADTFAPQKPLGLLQNKCLGTVSRLVKQGGIRGIGFTMITQRPASMNKDVLSQVDILTVLRMSHPLDIKAATDWIKSEVDIPFAKVVEAELPRLPVGTAFFCSAPLNLGERVDVRKRNTFNSGATPKPGERRIEPKVMAKVDIEKLGQEIAASVQRTREESPEFLKKRIAELEKEVAKGGKPDMELMKHVQELEEKAARVDELEQRVAVAETRAEKFLRFLDDMDTCIANARAGQDVVLPTIRHIPVAPSAAIARTISQTPRYEAPAPSNAPLGKEGALPNRILRSLAEFAAIGRHEVPRNVLSAWAEARGGFFNNTLSKMKTEGLVEYRSSGMVALTSDGTARAPRCERPANAKDFFQAVVRQAGTGLPERIMHRLVKDYPDSLSREELSGAVEARGGYFNNTLSGMKSAGFIEYAGAGQVRLQPWTMMQ